MIPVNDQIALEDDEIAEKFVRASGPGGQHVKLVQPISPP
jgi:protein subunit release factor B